MKAQKVLLLDEKTSYGFNSLLVQVIARCFRQRGYSTEIVDFAAKDIDRKLLDLYPDRASYAFAFSVGRKMSKVDGKSIHEHFGIPLFVAFVDHPLYKQDYIDFRMDTVVYGFTDPSHVEFAVQVYRGDRYVHFPHFSLLTAEADLSEAEFFRKTKSLFFPATAAIMGRVWSINSTGIEDSAILRSLAEKGAPISDFIKRFVRSGLDLVEDLSLFVKEHENKIGKIDLQIFGAIFRDSDVLVRSLRRQGVIKALDGLPLTVAGMGWGQCRYLGRSVKMLPPLDYRACEDTRRNYQMTLHTSHLQPYATHDRVLHAMSVGQAILAEASPYYEKEVSKGYIALFPSDAAGMAQIYSDLLNDDHRRFAMARAALETICRAPHADQVAADIVIQALRQRNLLGAN